LLVQSAARLDNPMAMKAKLLTAMIAPIVIGGCATGYASDWFRDEPGIIRPQLLRYGLDVEQSQCVSAALGGSLSKVEVRRLQEVAASVRPANEAVLNIGNLRAIAPSASGAARTALDLAIGSCNLQVAAAVPTVATSAAPAPATGTAPVTMSGNIPVDMTPATPPVTAQTWLNLGSAESGQSIGIDARSIEQEGTTRIAWFRMTDPDSGAATNNMYRLRIDCQARTIQPLALRQTDAAGVETSFRTYTPAEAVAGPAEAGTVLEIAFLSMCT
jgi:hypothetical protein